MNRVMTRYLLPALLFCCFGSEYCAAQPAGNNTAQPAAQNTVRETTTTPKTPAPSPPQPIAVRPDVEQPPDGQLPPEAHPWGRFPVGSWKTVRVTSESLDAQGRVVNTSITESKTTLIEANDHEYKLRVETTVEVAGKRFAHAPQVTQHSYWGELATATPAGLRKVSTSELELNGKRVACEVRQAVSERDGQRRQTVVHYTAAQFPYVLKRESSVTPIDGPALTTEVEVFAANLPYRVAGLLKPVAYVRTTYQGAKSSSVTVEIQSADVPGGVVNHSGQERDAAGVAVTRRTSLELVDYGVGSENPDEASPGRRRWFRSRRRGDDMNAGRRDR